MKRVFKIIILVFTIILFGTSVVWAIGMCTGSPMSFFYLLGHTSSITFGVGLFSLGLFGLCKLGDWALKKD